MPDFIHDFGWIGHHRALMRKVELDEDSDYIWDTAPPKWVFEAHEFLEYYLYKLRRFLQNNDGRSIKILDYPLSFIWGFICLFPPRDIVSYVNWMRKGNPPIRVWNEKGEITYG